MSIIYPIRTMKIIIDEREHSLYALFQPGLVTKCVLPLGDVIIQADDNETPLLIIERKTISDLLSSFQDGRYKEQSYRLQHATGLNPNRIIYVIEGAVSSENRQLINSTITSLIHYKGFTVRQTASTEDTKNLILDIVSKIERNTGLGKTFYATGGSETPQPNYSTTAKKVKRDNVTKENISEFMLSQIPAVSPAAAISITKVYPTMNRLMAALRENPGCLDGIMLDGGKKPRKINKTAIEGIKEFLMQE